MHVGTLGPVELVLIVLAIVLIFGTSKLAGLGGALGKSVKDFKRETHGDEEEPVPQPNATSRSAKPLDGRAAHLQQQTTAANVSEYKPADS